MDLFLGIDGGGTSTKASLLDLSGKVLGTGSSGPSNLYYTDPGVLQTSMKGAIEAALKEACAALSFNLTTCDIKYACVAMAGAGRPQDVQRAKDILEPIFSFCPFWVEEDSKAALSGSLAGEDGIVVIAGTGSNCLGVKSGKYKRAGGWGSLLGDEGSAYRIAVKGLSAALRAYDGRTWKTSLTERFLQELNLTVPDMILPKVHGMDRSQIASLAQWVFQEAEKDSIARNILKEEVQELLLMIEAVAAGLGFLGMKIPLALVGGCFKDRLYLSLFEKSLQERIPNAVITPSVFPPSVGAAIMARGKALSEHRKDVKSPCP